MPTPAHSDPPAPATNPRPGGRAQRRRGPAPASRGRLLPALGAAALVLGGCAGGRLPSEPAPSAPPPAAPGRVLAAAPADAARAARTAATVDDTTIVRVAAGAKPGIVQITNEQQDLQSQSSGLVPAGVGTGFVIDAAGHILTNNHVVADAQRLQVQTTDGLSLPAHLVGRDPRTDLAVLQVTGGDPAGRPAGGLRPVGGRAVGGGHRQRPLPALPRGHRGHRRRPAGGDLAGRPLPGLPRPVLPGGGLERPYLCIVSPRAAGRPSRWAPGSAGT
jgi:hypothetical protein